MRTSSTPACASSARARTPSVHARTIQRPIINISDSDGDGDMPLIPTSPPRAPRYIDRGMSMDSHHESRHTLPSDSGSRTEPLPTASLSDLPSDPPPSYSADYYISPDICTFSFSDTISQYLEMLRVDAWQCVKIDRSLDYHVTDWEVLFQQGELTAEQARALRELIFEELSPESRALMFVTCGGPNLSD
ncbi:hypothetical protein SCP_0109460 [Sparassis crispa]|uniref:Uncharacterized protein n=1 Tax=Sparassis crispa TaxID=139825 RepID=A0A401G7C8_9APHY|nr:hypothetical protein SCP_0109460 [Sparassis crispa]GBE78064.1 hypothetical protein SCP_0109460 [Sparassis crispa]